jgi:exopolyphosphatase/guanosine-5'-triphosphate,3'-diphosphate pyrophosphatase
VATQTLREARNRDVFLDKAQQILGFPIEVIPGREEARLIYAGVSHLLPQSDERRLVIDIGGRSTELVIGQGYQAQTLESYRVGSVAWSMKYFPEGHFTAMAFELAEVAAKAILDEVLNTYRRKDWDVAYGSSGTIGAVVDVLEAAGWPAGLINREGLQWLKDKLIKAGSADNIKLDGIKEDRRPVIGGGLAILCSLFDLLDIQELQAAQGALRQGALFDLLDRDEHADIRESMVDWLSKRFGIEEAQALRVSQTSTLLFQKISPARSEAESALDQDRLQRKLEWAARLHEVGSHISHADHHKHGAYILDNADLPGFSMPELHRLSQLVLGHRGKLRKLDMQLNDTGFVHQLFALRLAVILCHARRDPDLKGFELSLQEGTDKGFTITTRKGWATQWPQSAHLLREECLAWQKTAWSLAYNSL